VELELFPETAAVLAVVGLRRMGSWSTEHPRLFVTVFAVLLFLGIWAGSRAILETLFWLKDRRSGRS
jgi:hypothetical protein